MSQLLYQNHCWSELEQYYSHEDTKTMESNSLLWRCSSKKIHSLSGKTITTNDTHCWHPVFLSNLTFNALLNNQWKSCILIDTDRHLNAQLLKFQFYESHHSAPLSLQIIAVFSSVFLERVTAWASHKGDGKEIVVQRRGISGSCCIVEDWAPNWQTMDLLMLSITCSTLKILPVITLKLFA
jgi:hypothetical protein